MSFENVAQSAVYDLLSGSITGTVYDEPPDLPAGMPESDFPYTVIGDDTAQAWDTDDTLGKEVTITLHVWSRYRGSKEVKQILGEIYGLLHRARPEIDGYTVIDTLCEFTETRREMKPMIRHGIARYRMTIQKGS